VVASEVRFQFCLPTPLTVTALMVADEYSARFELSYEAAILRSLKEVQALVQASELAVQFDAPMEIAFLEGAELYGQDLKPWFDPVFDGIVHRLLRLGKAVCTDVELGYHFCYGDMGHEHFVEPRDTQKMVVLVDYRISVHHCAG
jgi:methionine synthase II (cobalamin-independent)